MNDSYKVQQLNRMLEEIQVDEYALARLKSDSSKAINLDEGALKLLMDYYSGKITASTQIPTKPITASDSGITYVAFYNEDILGNYDDYEQAVAELKAEIDEMIAAGKAHWVDFERCWIETDDEDEEVMYCADSDDDYAEYL